MNDPLRRAQLLINQHRFDLAEQELRAALAQDPDDALAHTWLAQALLGQRKPAAEAVREAQTAVHLAPDFPPAYYILSMAYQRLGKLREAEQAAHETIRLDAAFVSGYTRLAAVQSEACRWSDAYETAQRGLEIDPADVECANLRAMALRQMGRHDAAAAAIESALARDPEDAFTHANRGWQELERGDHRAAALHFREALRLNPEMEWARNGILEALRARNFAYRWMLRYFLWMDKLKPNVRWAVVVGGYVVSRLLRELGKQHPELLPIVIPLVVLYALFAYFTWTATPLLNLLLRMDPLGRAALSPLHLRLTNIVAVCVGGGVISLAAGIVFHSEAALVGALLAAMLLVPVSGLFSARSSLVLRGIAVYTAVMAVAGVIATVATGGIADGCLNLFLLMLLAYFWLGNLVLSRDRRP